MMISINDRITKDLLFRIGDGPPEISDGFAVRRHNKEMAGVLWVKFPSGQTARRPSALYQRHPWRQDEIKGLYLFRFRFNF